jgi:hypothetical protein
MQPQRRTVIQPPRRPTARVVAKASRTRCSAHGASPAAQSRGSPTRVEWSARDPGPPPSWRAPPQGGAAFLDINCGCPIYGAAQRLHTRPCGSQALTGMRALVQACGPCPAPPTTHVPATRNCLSAASLRHFILRSFLRVECLAPGPAEATRRGMGSAMLRKPRALARMVAGVVAESELPVTVKV